MPNIGDRVDVHVRILEGGKERIQVFQGVVLKMGGKGVSRSFTVRKISHGVGVERTFPLSSPVLAKVEILSKSKVRRAKLYYIRKLKGRASRLTSAFFHQTAGVEKETASKTAQMADKNAVDKKVVDKKVVDKNSQQDSQESVSSSSKPQ